MTIFSIFILAKWLLHLWNCIETLFDFDNSRLIVSRHIGIIELMFLLFNGFFIVRINYIIAVTIRVTRTYLILLFFWFLVKRTFWITIIIAITCVFILFAAITAVIVTPRRFPFMIFFSMIFEGKILFFIRIMRIRWCTWLFFLERWTKTNLEA